jgi:RimJ/RimL family protein N-acetyltransferase
MSEAAALLAAGKPVVIDGVLFNRDAEVAAWVNEVGDGGVVLIPLARAMAVVDDSGDGPARWVAGVSFWHQHAPRDGGVGDIMASVRAEPAFFERVGLLRPAIRMLLSYPFEMLSLGRVTVEVDHANERVIRAAHQLGFEIEGRKRRMGSSGGDFLIMGLLKETARARRFWYPVLEAEAA